MRAIVMGIGPIGGIIGGRLARAGHDLTFVDVDREHVAAIRENGLQVDVPDGAFNVKATVVFADEIQGTFDTAFIAVRCNYTADTLATALPHLNEDGLVVSMQNGINVPLLEEAVGADRTVGMGIRMGQPAYRPRTGAHRHARPPLHRPFPRPHDSAAGRAQHHARRRDPQRDHGQHPGSVVEQAHLHLLRLLRLAGEHADGGELRQPRRPATAGGFSGGGGSRGHGRRRPVHFPGPSTTRPTFIPTRARGERARP